MGSGPPTGTDTSAGRGGVVLGQCTCRDLLAVDILNAVRKVAVAMRPLVTVVCSNLLLYHDDDHDVEEDEAAESEAIVQRGHGVEKHRG